MLLVEVIWSLWDLDLFEDLVVGLTHNFLLLLDAADVLYHEVRLNDCVAALEVVLNLSLIIDIHLSLLPQIFKVESKVFLLHGHHFGQSLNRVETDHLVLSFLLLVLALVLLYKLLNSKTFLCLLLWLIKLVSCILVESGLISH